VSLDPVDNAYRSLLVEILFVAVRDWKSYQDVDSRRSVEIVAEYPWIGNRSPDFANACHYAIGCGFDSPRNEMIRFFNSDWCLYMLDGLDLDRDEILNQIGVPSE
jgi:hypothetical protein